MEADGDLVALEDCSEFQKLELGIECPYEGEQNSLSNYVCYNMDGTAEKVDAQACDECTPISIETDPPAIETEPPAIETEPPVEECPMDYLDNNNGITYSGCPSSANSIVTLTASAGYDGDLDVNGVGVIYDILLPTDGSNEVTFKVNNLFETASDVYVRYSAFATIGGSVSSFRNYECDEVQAQPACVDETYGENSITAACHTQGYTLVYVYFATSDPAVLAFAGEDATIDKCCYPDDYDLTTTGLVELVYKIQCDCPPVAEGRFLRGSF